MKCQLSIKYESQILPSTIGSKNVASQQREVKRRRVEDTMGSVEVKNFSFGVFDNKTNFFEKIGKDTITTVKTTVQNVKRFALRNKKTIINKRDNRNRNF